MTGAHRGDVIGHPGQEDITRDGATHRLTVGSGHKDPDRVVAHGIARLGQVGARGRRPRPLSHQAPRDHAPVGLVAPVQRVVHGTVEVLVVPRHLGAQLGDVEVGVAAHERVEGPGDQTEVAGERPCPLVLLQREPDVVGLVTRAHARHDRVEVDTLLAAAMDSRRRGHQLVSSPCTRHVVAGRRERAQQVRGDGG